MLGVDTQQTLEWVLDQALSEQTPDAIVASGDIAHDPLPDNYRRFLATVSQVCAAPMLALPGNHDVVDAMIQAQLPMDGLDLGSWGLVALDSHEDEAPSALVTERDKQAAQHEMERLDGPEHILLATHHHLVPVNCPWLDRDRVQMPQDLIKWLRQASAQRLRGCIFGHVHQEVADFVEIESATDAGLKDIPVWSVPSTCFQFLPRSQSFAVDALGPGYRWLYLEGDGSIRTVVKRITQTIEVDMSRFS